MVLRTLGAAGSLTGDRRPTAAVVVRVSDRTRPRRDAEFLLAAAAWSANRGLPDRGECEVVPPVQRDALPCGKVRPPRLRVLAARPEHVHEAHAEVVLVRGGRLGLHARNTQPAHYAGAGLVPPGQHPVQVRKGERHQARPPGVRVRAGQALYVGNADRPCLGHLDRAAAHRNGDNVRRRAALVESAGRRNGVLRVEHHIAPQGHEPVLRPVDHDRVLLREEERQTDVDRVGHGRGAGPGIEPDLRVVQVALQPEIDVPFDPLVLRRDVLTLLVPQGRQARRTCRRPRQDADRRHHEDAERRHNCCAMHSAHSPHVTLPPPALRGLRGRDCVTGYLLAPW